MKITDDPKNQDGDVSATNGNLSQDEDLEIQTTFENQNGTSPNESRDSGSPIDMIPFNIEGIQTVVKNSSDTKAVFENGASSQSLLEAELQRYKEENSQLRAALKEASRVNQQWRSYHDQRQSYVQKLLTSLHDLQQTTCLKQGNGRSSNIELQRLRESFSRQQKEHNEHIQLLQMQVRAHRDDWEAERSEKKVAEIGRIQAETQLQITQGHLEEAKNSIMELEARMKLCKCFAGSSFISGNERILQAFRHYNGNLGPSDAVSRISPSLCTSANSVCSSTSRSSSVSRELSANSSPTIMKSLQPSPPCRISQEVNGATSPPARVPSRSSCNKANDSYHTHENTEEGIETTASTCPQNIKQEDLILKSSLKETQNCSDGYSKSKSNGNVKGELSSENSTAYYEPKGARPKSSSLKSSDEEERKAKRRARSILASALPMSPSGSKSSSPVTVPSNKGIHIPKGYMPITSTVLTPVRLKIPGSSNRTSEQNQFHKLNEKKNSTIESSDSSFNKLTESSKANYFNKDTKYEDIDIHKNSNQKQQHKLHCSKHAKAGNSESNGFVCHKNQLSPLPKTKIRHTNGHFNDQTDCKQCSSIHINDINIHSVSPCDFHERNKLYNNDSNRNIGSHDDNNSSKELLEIKTAAQMKQNTKSLLVTNSHEKCNTNYASITVMPGPSSALFSHTQTTSTTLPRSTSPGISLTTFALNANGQGVPGAIFFALGTDTKLPKHSQQQQSAGNNGESQDELSTKNVMIAKEPHDEVTSERIVNSTWVQLTENDCNSARLTQKTPWRTARAVPSHKLNSVRKTHAGENGSNGPSPTFAEEIKKNENVYHSYNYGTSTMCHCNGNGHPQYLQSYESRYQTSFSPPPTYGSCPRTSPSISLTPPQSHSQNDCRNGGSPTICMIPHSTYSQSCAESDLRSMASKNISSAILSYECGSLGCRTIHARKVIADKQSNLPAIEEKPRELQPKAEINSESYLICPSCQKLYTSDNGPIYEQHIQACGGPKYADM